VSTATARPFVVGACEHAHGRPVLEYAIRHAHQEGGEVVAVHVRRSLSPLSTYYDTTGSVPAWSAECEDIAFNQVRAVLGGQVPKWRYVVRRGDVATALAAVAQQMGARVILVGESPKGWLRRLCTGSVARALARRRTLTVKVVSQAGTSARTPRTLILRGGTP
jgi:nucleotide-binding universal stress UspA family protein